MKKKPVEPVKRGRGRPATGRQKEIRMEVRMTAEQREILEAAAQREGMPLTVWALAAMLAVAKMTGKP